MVEEAHARLRSDILSTGVHEVYIRFLFHLLCGYHGTEAHSPVFGMVDDGHSFGHKTGNQCGDTYA